MIWLVTISAEETHLNITAGTINTSMAPNVGNNSTVQAKSEHFTRQVNQRGIKRQHHKLSLTDEETNKRLRYDSATDLLEVINMIRASNQHLVNTIMSLLPSSKETRRQTFTGLACTSAVPQHSHCTH